ncbi:MAG: hypothetical protein H7Y03_07560 [Chitinophagaceae bacterium]|nr:hypothetical protein [Chitinophagaceae bacterium]
MKQILVILSGVFTLLVTSCRKDSFITSRDAEISITADSIRYDTVFTSTGSVTQVFKIINENSQKLRLDQISLGGGSNSHFNINADGFTGPLITNIEIDANDSIYVFTTVSIDPNAEELPFVVKDSIRIAYNGNERLVHLEAYGQNAHFLRNWEITTDTIWPNNLPYVILGGLLIKENATLTIEKGARLYFHSDAPLLVDGTLITQGSKDTSGRVYFKSDRLDLPYSGYPGSWPGIYFRVASDNNVLNGAVISNSYQGVVAQGPSASAAPKLILADCIIDNIYDAGVLGVATSIRATNCVISNAGGEASNNLSLVYGGNYDFTHCTVVTYNNSYITHKNPVFFLSNFIIENNVKYPLDLTASFTNCIFWGDGGSVEDEVLVSKDGSTVFDVQFTNCLYKVKNPPLNVTLKDMILNEDPAFDSTDAEKRFFNFQLKENSPALNKGVSTPLVTDAAGNPRVVGAQADLGAYERQ